MNDIEAEKVRAAISTAVRILDESERGRAVRKDLHKLLDGSIYWLDGTGWDAVFALMEAYNGGFKGSVLEALE